MFTAKKQYIVVYSSLSIGWLLLMLAIFSLILSGCTKEVLGGSGLVITQQRPVGQFTDVMVDGRFKVTFHESDTTSVEVSADDNLLRVIEIYVIDSTLHIQLKKGVRVVMGNMLVNIKSPVYHAITWSTINTDGTISNSAEKF